MSEPIVRAVTRWIWSNLVWDTSGRSRGGVWGRLWPARKLLLALAGSAVLDWMEWVEHHPPAIAIVAVLHFLFVLAAIAAAIPILRRLSRASQPPAAPPPQAG